MADSTFPLTPAAIAVPALGLITLILDSPPLIWHIRNRNFGASSLVSWIILCNLMNFINSLIWPTDDIKNWWNGKVLCDIEVKLMTAVYIGVVGSLVSIMRSLARVLDTENTVLYPSTAQKRRQNAIDCLVCIGAPIYMMLIHYIVQPSRYYIYAISGCVTSFDNSWPKLLLVFIWPPIFCLVVVGYSGTVTLVPYNSCHTNILQYLSSTACANTAKISPQSSTPRTLRSPGTASCGYSGCP